MKTCINDIVKVALQLRDRPGEHIPTRADPVVATVLRLKGRHRREAFTVVQYEGRSYGILCDGEPIYALTWRVDQIDLCIDAACALSQTTRPKSRQEISGVSAPDSCVMNPLRPATSLAEDTDTRTPLIIDSAVQH